MCPPTGPGSSSNVHSHFQLTVPTVHFPPLASPGRATDSFRALLRNDFADGGQEELVIIKKIECANCIKFISPF